MDEKYSDLLAQGRKLFEAGDYQEAEKLLAECVQNKIGFADIYNMLGIIYHQQGRLVDARDSFEKALEINPNYVEASLHLSITLADLGLSEQAEKVMDSVARKAVEKGGSLDPVSRANIANMHADLAQAYLAGSCLEDALNEYDKALKICPDFVDLRTKRAVLLMDMGKSEQALEELRAVKKEKPKYLEARIQLGLALLSQGLREEAIKELEETLAFAPDYTRAKMYLDLLKNSSI
ncbi:MAG: tetratricopeptide repeat protein [Deltaproteobacteria bacterium]|nr:tetratricopeptide repeat protein [Deltaproteobacteria bacterium]